MPGVDRDEAGVNSLLLATRTTSFRRSPPARGTPGASPAEISVRKLRARLLVALGRADEAREWGERALGFLDPDLADCLDELGVLGLAEARLAAGDAAGAREVVAVAWDSLERLPLSPDERASCYGRRIVRDLIALAGHLGFASRSSPAD